MLRMFTLLDYQLIEVNMEVATKSYEQDTTAKTDLFEYRFLL